MKTVKVEAFVLVDEQGDYVASHDRDQLKEIYENSVGELDGTLGVRIVKIEMEVPVGETVIRAKINAEAEPTVTVK